MTHKTPKVSIVVPVFNCEKYLIDCLDSIYKQLFRDWECIIWDDGSNDGSLEIIRAYCSMDKRFICGFSEANYGLPATLNLGYAFSKGEYICQVDADDMLLPMALFETVAYLESHKDVGIVYTNKLTINESGTYFSQHQNNIEHYSRVKLFYTFPLVTHFRLMRKEVWVNLGGYREDITFAEDDDFAIRAAWGIKSNGKRVKPVKIKKFNSICYVYRIRAGSMTNSVRDDNKINENREYLKKKALWYICKFWRLKALLEQIKWHIYLLEKGDI